MYKRAALNSESFREQDFRGLELIRELDDEDRDRFALLFVVRSGHFHRFDCTKRKRTAKDERNASKKSRICPTLADLGLIVEKAYDRR